MPNADVLDLIFKITGGAGGALGTVLSLYNFVHARRQETRDKSLEAKDIELYLATQAEVYKKGANCINPKLGSTEQQWADRMTKRGLMRQYGGVYYFAYHDVHLSGSEEEKPPIE